MKPFVYCLISLLFFESCGLKQKPEMEDNGAFMKAKNEVSVNLDRIINSGELIITTLSGPDTYFDYQGAKLGLQYALAENFATSLGIGVRVELARDTTEMVKKLQAGDVDLIAFQLPDKYCQKAGIMEAGAKSHESKTSWAIRKDATDLREELDFWYKQDIEIVVRKVESKKFHARRQVRHKVHAPFISREKGLISIYDSHFKKAALHLGWDWKLLAAQCYQESQFDPNAISYMGAQGLMQIMPSTAQHLNLPHHKIFIPSDNINAAARYLQELKRKFGAIRDPNEQIKFVLASYNGGPGHIMDAQALARKYGKNPHRWEDVSHFVLKLSEPRYYRDPIVRYGYMIGAETFSYVNDILRRWQMYGGRVASTNLSTYSPANDIPVASENRNRPNKRKKNRFSKEQKIYSLDELGK